MIEEKTLEQIENEVQKHNEHIRLKMKQAEMNKTQKFKGVNPEATEKNASKAESNYMPEISLQTITQESVCNSEMPLLPHQFQPSTKSKYPAIAKNPLGDRTATLNHQPVVENA